MNIKPLVAMTLLLSCGSALAAEQDLASVEVRPQARFTLTFDCASPASARPADVEHILNVNDRTQTRELGNKLMVAVGQACNAGVSSIIVNRAASGRSLTWAPAREVALSVASN